MVPGSDATFSHPSFREGSFISSFEKFLSLAFMIGVTASDRVTGYDLSTRYGADNAILLGKGKNRIYLSEVIALTVHRVQCYFNFPLFWEKSFVPSVILTQILTDRFSVLVFFGRIVLNH